MNFIDSVALKQNVNILKQNLFQLQACLESRGIATIFSEEEMEQALKHPASKDSITELNQMIGNIKKKLYDVMDSPIETTIGMCGLLVLYIVFMFWILYDRTVMRLPWIIWLIIPGVYFPPLIHLLFSYGFYSKVFSKGTCFFLPSSFLTVTAYFLWQRQYNYSKEISKVENPLGRGVEPHPISSFQDLSTKLLFCGFLMNWIELAVTLLFGAMWKQIFSSMEYSNELVYILFALLLLWFHYSLAKGKQAIVAPQSKIVILRKTILSIPFIVCMVVLGLFRMYEATEGESERYMYAGVHEFVVWACVFGVSWLLIYHLLYRLSLHVSIWDYYCDCMLY